MTGSRLEKVGGNERGGQDTSLERTVVDGRAAKNRIIKTTDLAVRHFRRYLANYFGHDTSKISSNFVAYFHSLSGPECTRALSGRDSIYFTLCILFTTYFLMSRSRLQFASATFVSTVTTYQVPT